MSTPRPRKPNRTRSALHSIHERRSQRPQEPGWRQKTYDIIFEAETPAGRWFDICLLLAIVASIALVSLETVPEPSDGPTQLYAGSSLDAWYERGEWLLTIVFTVEYGLRLACVRRPLKYALSFWGIVDLVSILPMYLTLFVSRSPRTFVILRSIRLLRVFRVLKLWRMMSEADELADAVWRSRDKVVVFLSVVLVAVTISGTLMYHIETVWAGEQNDSDFTSIPQAMYWAIVTMTTVGYGDIVPHTTAGKMISAALILLGYSLIIVPTGFVSAELAHASSPIPPEVDSHPCPQCEVREHRIDATYCFRCGAHLQNVGVQPEES